MLGGEGGGGSEEGGMRVVDLRTMAHDSNDVRMSKDGLQTQHSLCNVKFGLIKVTSATFVCMCLVCVY